MVKGIFILGNGFDLDLGLSTSYSEFAQSRQWAELMDASTHSQSEAWLLGFLRNKYQVEKWIDIEAALLEYAKIKTHKRDTDHAHEDKEDFFALCNSLRSYLIEQQSSFTPKPNSVASVLLKYLVGLSTFAKIYTFNYTQPRILADKLNYVLVHDVEHLHGSLSDGDDIILGIETRESIDDNYAFLFKTQNRQYRHTNILKDLKDRDEYVFFGHALNGMDYAYFKSTFSLLESSSLKTPRLTIITKNIESEESFKVFLRKEYISLQGLYSNAEPVFILTDEFYRQNESERRKVVDLLSRMRAM